jgi:hypothetical protein
LLVLVPLVVLIRETPLKALRCSALLSYDEGARVRSNFKAKARARDDTDVAHELNIPERSKVDLFAAGRTDKGRERRKTSGFLAADHELSHEVSRIVRKESRFEGEP